MCIEKRILFVIFRASNKRKDHKSGITPTSVSVEEVDFGTVLQRISTSQVGARIRGVQLGRHLWSLNKASLRSKPVKSHEDIKKSMNRLIVIPEQEAQQESRIQGPLSLLLAWTTLSSPPQPKIHRKTRLTECFKRYLSKEAGLLLLHVKGEGDAVRERPWSPAQRDRINLPRDLFNVICETNIRNTSLNYLTVHCCLLLDIACGTSDLHLTKSL